MILICNLSGEQMSVFALTASEYILFYDQITRVVIKSYLFLLISYLRCRRHWRTKHRRRSSWSPLSGSSFRPINRHSHFKNKDRISTEKRRIANCNCQRKMATCVSSSSSPLSYSPTDNGSRGSFERPSRPHFL